MTPEEIRQLSGPALDAEVERVSGLRLEWKGNSWAVYDTPLEPERGGSKRQLANLFLEPDARDFIAVLLLQEASNRGLAVEFENCDDNGKTVWRAGVEDTEAAGTPYEAVSRAFLLAAKEGT